MRLSIISYHSSPLEPVGSGSSGGMTIFLNKLYRRLGYSEEIDIFTSGKEGNTRIGPTRVIFIESENLDEFAERIINYHKLRQYDLIHTHYWLSGIVGLKTRRVLKTPWVHSFHTVEFLKGIRRDKMRVEVEAEIIKHCDFIISPTKREAEAIKELYQHAKIISIPHGVDFQNVTSGGNGNSKLLYVGRIAPIKGLDVLIDALKLLKGRVTLDIIGGVSKGKDYFEDIKSSAEGLPVNFRGTVPHEEIYSWYKDASIIIVPSYYESFGLVGLEAMVSAKPVVSFSDTGLSETVGQDSGILLDRNTRNLAKAIDFLIDNQTLRYTLGINGRRKSQKYKWSNIAWRYLKVYEKIIKN